jgi:hypothetical protein
MDDVFARAEEKAWLLERTRNLGVATDAAKLTEKN